MVKNRKLSKQISDVAWGKFLTLLEYKGDINGCKIKRVDRFFPSSKRCSNCGEKVQKTLSTRTHICLYCGYVEDRDTNAAINILQKAIK